MRNVSHLCCHVIQISEKVKCIFNLVSFFVGPNHLPADLSKLFVGALVTITCAPPPELSFGNVQTAVWTHDGIEVNAKEYKVTTTDVKSTLTVYTFYRTNDGKKLIQSWESVVVFFILCH